MQGDKVYFKMTYEIKHAYCPIEPRNIYLIWAYLSKRKMSRRCVSVIQ